MECGRVECSRIEWCKVELNSGVWQSGAKWSVVELCKVELTVECGRAVQSGAGGAVHGTT